MAALSFPLSLYLRLGPSISDTPTELLVFYTASFAGIAGVVFFFTGLYRGIWRYASLPDLMGVIRATTFVMLLFFATMFVATRLAEMPRSTVVINWFVLAALLGGPRFAYRIVKDRGLDHILEKTSREAIPILLIGAGDGAAAFIGEMARDRNALYRVVGIVGVRSTRVGREIGGVPVLGRIEELPEIVAALERRGEKPQRFLISIQDIEGAAVRQLLDLSEQLAIPLARLPRMTDFKETVGTQRSIEPIAIEDLLGRPQAVLDREGMRALIAGRRVLVTGAGGTIGSELVRQIAASDPERLVLFDSGEYALYTIDREMGERFPLLSRNAVVGDVRDRRRIEEVLAAETPELVFHAAALKHVPIVEANPAEGVLTNVMGTRNLAESCIAAGVKVMVMISTDKAVNPANVMGATKRLAESVCQALDLTTTGTRFVTVRFGNVLGSTGSVVPLFQRQLAAGGPLTVTHPNITRFFMTVREAVELVLQSSVLASSSEEERGKIFVLDMGEPVKIADLARQMIRLAGFQPEKDIKIEFVGLRPGEKLYEELFYKNETLVPTKVDGIQLAAPRMISYAELSEALDKLEEVAHHRRNDILPALLRQLVPEFQGAEDD